MPRNANQQQLYYNAAEANQERSRLLTGYGNLNSEGQIAHARSKRKITELREQEKASFAQRENDRINGPNAFEIQESSMGPMIPLDTTIPKGDALGEGLGDNVIGNFNQNAVTAASNTFGNQIPNSFNREMPTMQELNPDQTGMNSLYNKTI
jgi:hypothetical protein|tara:strand:+ start:153 stop:608 length:456 start_codon:yes stop_codon:yes gene_type:complete